jgi:hypothetical protein
MTADWRSDIFRQKSLWQVYSLSRVALPRPVSSQIVESFAAFMIGASLVFAPFIGDPPYQSDDALKFLRWSSNQSFTFALGVLGFLIAGFAIFASITKANIFIALACVPYFAYDKINNLQYVFFNFLNVFTVYIGLLIFVLIVQFSTADGSPILHIFAKSKIHSDNLTIQTIQACTFFICTWTVIAILRLKSFIWSLYQTVLFVIAMEDEMNKQAEESSRGRSVLQNLNGDGNSRTG